MVPISVLAFFCAIHSIGSEKLDVNNIKFSWFDIIGLVIVGLGVLTHNFFELKPQKASIEEDF
jgi:hypothetical protein